MKRVISLSALMFLSMPLSALSAKLVPCGGPGEDACEACHVITLISNVTNWLIAILSILFAIIVIYAGFKLVTSAGNVSAMQAARKMLSNAIIGFIIVLAAWLLIDLLMKTILDGGTGSIKNFGPWNSIECGVAPGTFGGGFGGGNGGGNGGGAGGGPVSDSGGCENATHSAGDQDGCYIGNASVPIAFPVSPRGPTPQYPNAINEETAYLRLEANGVLMWYNAARLTGSSERQIDTLIALSDQCDCGDLRIGGGAWNSMPGVNPGTYYEGRLAPNQYRLLMNPDLEEILLNGSPVSEDMFSDTYRVNIAGCSATVRNYPENKRGGTFAGSFMLDLSACH